MILNSYAAGKRACLVDDHCCLSKWRYRALKGCGAGPRHSSGPPGRHTQGLLGSGVVPGQSSPPKKQFCSTCYASDGDAKLLGPRDSWTWGWRRRERRGAGRATSRPASQQQCSWGRTGAAPGDKQAMDGCQMGVIAFPWQVCSYGRRRGVARRNDGERECERRVGDRVRSRSRSSRRGRTNADKPRDYAVQCIMRDGGEKTKR